MKLLFLSPNQNDRYNRGHQQFRNEFKNHFETIYCGNGFNEFSHDAVQLEKKYEPDIIATYGLKYTKPYKHLSKTNAIKVHFVCDYLTPTSNFWGYEREYDALLKRDQYDILFCRTIRVANYLITKPFAPKYIYFLPFSIDPATYYSSGYDRQIDISTCWSVDDRIYPNRNKINKFLNENFRHKNIVTKNVYRDEFIKILQQSKISINSLSAWKGLNMKVFEAMACGALCFTDYSEDMSAIGLLQGKHFVVYNTLQDLKEKLNYYLNHPNELNQIAMYGYEKIKKHHNHSKAVQTVKHLIFGAIYNDYNNDCNIAPQNLRANI